MKLEKTTKNDDYETSFTDAVTTVDTIKNTNSTTETTSIEDSENTQKPEVTTFKSTNTTTDEIKKTENQDYETESTTSLNQQIIIGLYFFDVIWFVKVDKKLVKNQILTWVKTLKSKIRFFIIIYVCMS